MEFHLFLPQMRMAPEVLVERVQAAEQAGFAGVALMDHLTPPRAEASPMFEAFGTATWLAAHTSRLTIGHLVLCDSFRSPAVLARQAATLDHLSGGRFELGIGSGSTPAELDAFGLDEMTPGRRITRLGETLEVLELLWSGETVDYDGTFHRLEGVRQLPVPTRPIPIVIGGAGRRTLELVARHAHWWNLAVNDVPRLDEVRQGAGSARVSVQQMVNVITDESTRREAVELAVKRFGWPAEPEFGAVGNTQELVERFAGLAERGIERIYGWFTDFARPETLERFGAEVISLLGL